MIKVTIDAPPARAGMFAQMIEDERLQVTFERPIERRSAGGDSAMRIVYWISEDAVAGLVGGGAFAAATRAVRKIRERFSNIHVEIDAGDDEIPRNTGQVTDSKGDAAQRFQERMALPKTGKSGITIVKHATPLVVETANTADDEG